jgi:hypothetical protein
MVFLSINASNDFLAYLRHITNIDSNPNYNKNRKKRAKNAKINKKDLKIGLSYNMWAYQDFHVVAKATP